MDSLRFLSFFFFLSGIRAYVHCPHGFEIHGDACYFFSYDKETWIGAFESCKLFGSKLVEVNDKIENDYIAGRVQRFKAASRPDGRWWIGLADKQVENEWEWETSKVLVTRAVYSNWGQNEPNGDIGENCAFYGGPQWGDGSCSSIEYYICEADGIADQIVG